MYLKPTEIVGSTLLINNDGNVILQVGSNESVILAPPKNRTSVYKKNETYLNQTLKDSQGTPKNYLTNGVRMEPGQFISSPNGVFRARFTQRGVLALETTITSCPMDNNGNGVSYADKTDGADSVYFLNDYRYSVRDNMAPPSQDAAPSNLVNKFENSTKIKCINACNNDTRCESLSFYSPKNTQYNCMMYNTKSDQLAETKGATYMMRNSTTKDAIDQNNEKAGYLNESGELYTYTPDQISYEYTSETKGTPGDWRKGFTWNKQTYISKKDMTRLATESMYVDKSDPVDGEMSEDICADLCSSDDYCKEFTFYEKSGDRIECGIIKTGAKYDKIPSDYGSTYTRIPRVKDSETDVSAPRKLINIGSDMWNSLPTPSGGMGPEIMGPKATLMKRVDVANEDSVDDGFTTIKGGTRKIPDINKLKQMLKERKKISSAKKSLKYASVGVEGFGSSSVSGCDNPNLDASMKKKCSSYKLFGDLKRAENEHARTKHHIQAMHDTSYMEMERQNSITANLVILTVVTAIFGADFIRYAYNK
jgi:hypothetical protein